MCWHYSAALEMTTFTARRLVLRTSTVHVRTRKRTRASKIRITAIHNPMAREPTHQPKKSAQTPRIWTTCRGFGGVFPLCNSESQEAWEPQTWQKTSPVEPAKCGIPLRRAQVARVTQMVTKKILLPWAGLHRPQTVPQRLLVRPKLFPGCQANPQGQETQTMMVSLSKP